MPVSLNLIAVALSRRYPPRDEVILSDDYQTIWNTLEMDRTVQIDQTMVSNTPNDWRDTLRNSLPHLPVGEGEDAQFQMAGLIGRGGMGVVHEARQRSLAREVAIKMVPPDKVSRSAENALLQEARVMGMVEHPNVVPVHMIGQDDSGRPVIVMKRIHGTPWSDYIDGAAEVPDEDALTFHLEISKAACRALSFAHDRGIIHRDLKPENVMIGRFGEVYLLDWGLAVALRDNVGKIPLADTSDEVVGTPAFMAPEMTVGRGDRLSHRTDIFLLGSTLFCAITGYPPHDGDSLFAVMSAAYMGRRRDYPVSIPSELREICDRAMALDPADRFQTADEMREAIDAFLAHRASHTLVADARKRLFALREAIVAGDEDTVHQVFGEARFGFASALKIWSENEDAITGLQDTVVAMIEFEVDHENLAAARALYVQLPQPDETVFATIEALAEELGTREAKLKKIAFDYDESVGISERRWLIGVMGSLLFFAPLYKWFFVEGWTVPESFQRWTTDPVVFVTVIFGFTFLPILAAIIFVTAKYYSHHKVSRIFTAGLTVMYIFGMIARSMALFGDVPLHNALAMELGVHCSGLFCLGLAIDRRLGRAGFVATGTMVSVLLFPAYAVELFCFGLGLASIAFATFKGGGSALPWSDR